MTWLLNKQPYPTENALLDAIATHVEERTRMDLGSIDHTDDPTTAREALNQLISEQGSTTAALKYLQQHVDYEDLPLEVRA